MSSDVNSDVSRTTEPRRRNRRSWAALAETGLLLVLLLGVSGLVYLLLRVLCCAQ